MWYRLNADAKLVWTDYASSEYSAHNYYLLKYRTLVIFSLFSSKMEHYMNSTVYTVVQIILNMQKIQPADCCLDENIWIYPEHCKTSKLSAKSWNRAFVSENLVSLVWGKVNLAWLSQPLLTNQIWKYLSFFDFSSSFDQSGFCGVHFHFFYANFCFKS